MKKAVVILLLFVSHLALSQPRISLNGYVKILGTFNNINSAYIPKGYLPPALEPLFPYSSQDYQIHNRINFEWFGPSGLRAGIGMRNRLFWGYQVRSFAQHSNLYALLGYNSFENLVDFNNYLELDILWWQNEKTVFYTVFDRMWLQLEKEKFRIRIGRQRINWGINNTFNPNDLFNQYNFFDFDYEERPGVDAVLGQYYINSLSSLELAFTPGPDSVQQSVGAILYRLNKFNYDWQALVGFFKNDVALGFGWAGNLRDASFKGEVSYFVPLNKATSQKNLVMSVSVDYSFKKGIYLLGGIVFNQMGTTNPTLLDQALVANQNLSAKNIFPYKYTFLASTGYNFTPLFRADFTWMQTPDLANAFAIPSLSYSLLENLDLLVLGQLYFADNPQTQQFGFFSSSIFTRLKFSF